MPLEQLRVWKSGGALGYADLGGHEGRNASVWRLVQMADAKYGLPNFPPVLVSTADRPVEGALCFSSAGGVGATVPDFLFDAWPEVGISDYERERQAVAEAGSTPAAEGVAGWIGNADTCPARRVLLALAGASPLIRATHAPWPPDGTQRLTLVEQVQRWGMLIDLEGAGWSARLKLLLHSGRPVLLVDRPWREFFWPHLRPWKHFIPVLRDLSDLVDRVEWAHRHWSEALAIGAEGQRFARYWLTRDRALAEWACVLADQANKGGA